MRLIGSLTPVKLVIFDWNGTLLNDWKLAHKAAVAQFNAFSIPAPTEDEYRHGISANYVEFYMTHGFPRPDTEKGLELLKASLNQVRTAYLRKYWWDVELNRGAGDLLRFLSDHNIRTAVVSAEEKVLLRDRLVQFQIRSYLDRVTGGASGKDGKLKALRETAEYFGIEPKECAYVDDTSDGIMSAKSAGMKTIAILGGYNTWDAVIGAKPDFATPEFANVRKFFLT